MRQRPVNYEQLKKTTFDRFLAYNDEEIEKCDDEYLKLYLRENRSELGRAEKEALAERTRKLAEVVVDDIERDEWLDELPRCAMSLKQLYTEAQKRVSDDCPFEMLLFDIFVRVMKYMSSLPTRNAVGQIAANTSDFRSSIAQEWLSINPPSPPSYPVSRLQHDPMSRPQHDPKPDRPYDAWRDL